MKKIALILLALILSSCNDQGITYQTTETSVSGGIIENDESTLDIQLPDEENSENSVDSGLHTAIQGSAMAEEKTEETVTITPKMTEGSKTTTPKVTEKSKETTPKATEKPKETTPKATEKSKETTPKVTEKSKETTPKATEKPKETTPPKKPAENSNSQSTFDEKINEVVRLVNIERKKVGATPLKISKPATDAAQLRAVEIRTLFSHTRPDGTSISELMSEFSISWSKWGENIAYGQSTPAQVMDSWMNSPGHRENILNPGFTHIGVGCYVVNNVHYWTQIFYTPL